jgi:hypothetical protein
MSARQQDWREAADNACNLSELKLTLGETVGAIDAASQSVAYADHSGVWIPRMINRTTHADALHQAGRWIEAEGLFREAERIQAEMQPEKPLLYSVQGFRYCDLLLAASERAAWQFILSSLLATNNSSLRDACRSVFQRATGALKLDEPSGRLLCIGIQRLTLGRAALYEAILAKAGRGVWNAEWDTARRELNAAVSDFRRAGTMHHIPRGLLTRAWVCFLDGVRTGPESAQSNLDEAWEIAERGPMKLFLTDIHLYRARLFFREKPYPWESSAADLAAAEKLINECGYHRRDGEFGDAKRAILGE